MAVRKDTIWERFLSPIVRNFIDEEHLQELSKSIDWDKESDRFRRPDVIYPDY
ncbi:MAG TPA: methyltransferase type 11, partial [Cyanophyceae cyanobacterium]